jgi:hypothetical protein
MPSSIGVTLIACCFALIPLVGVPADLRGTLTLSDSTKVSAYPPYTVERKADFLDLSTSPRLDLTLPPARHSNFSIGYGPQITWHDINHSEEELLFLHVGSASFSTGLRHTQLAFGETVSDGKQTFGTLGALAPAPAPAANAGPMPPQTQQTPQLLPAKSWVKVFSELTSASVGTTIDRRSTISAYASYGISGGADEVNQQYLQQQRTATLSGSYGYAFTRRDTVAANVTTSHANVKPTGAEYWLVNTYATWRHALDRRLSSSLGLGISQSWTRTVGGWSYGINPTTFANLTGALYSYRRRRFSVEVSMSAGLSPTINALTGDLQPTLGAGAVVAARQDKTTLTASLAASESVAANFVGVGFMASHQLSSLFELFAGYFTAVQTADNPAYSLGRRWSAFAGLTMRAPPLSF